MNAFGGNWTQSKLDMLEDYLIAYRRIFSANERARYFNTTYVDAFAGTGGDESSSRYSARSLTKDEEAVEIREFLSGSVRRALGLSDPFDNYLLIDQSAGNVERLRSVAAEYPDVSKSVDVRRGDANEVLSAWCRCQDWRSNRAVVFLDPFGMQVEWQLLKTIAETKGIDLWLLFPSGLGVNRMLTRDGDIPDNWIERLNRFFGDDEWKSVFYKPHPQLSMFDESPQQLVKHADAETIARYFLNRLRTVFGDGVADNPAPLANRSGSTMFHLFFACANEKGAPTAIRIAQHILGGRKRGSSKSN